MKHLFYYAVLIVIACASFSCVNKNEQKVNVPQYIDKPTYQLYQTQNMWNFIKLNTQNGKMWIVQYSIESDSTRFEAPLNEASLLSEGQKNINGRFTLIPTSNMWNFILLDQIDGKQWQVQWTTDANNYIIPIK